jgi:hypothetical protein
MPHRRNRLKLTGDTHPPEVELDLGSEDDEQFEAEPEVSTPARFASRPGLISSPASAPRRQPAPIPYRTIGLTLLGVFVIARLLRL